MSRADAVQAGLRVLRNQRPVQHEHFVLTEGLKERRERENIKTLSKYIKVLELNSQG